MRRHLMEADVYDNNNNADMRTAWPERIPFAGDHHMRYADRDLEAEAYGEMYGAAVARGGGGGGGWRHSGREEQPRSMMAGLTGPDRGMGRVGEWLAYVDPNDLEGESDSVVE